MNIKELIPKNKFDENAISKLKTCSFEQLQPIIPELLEWLQDGNWPIAKPMADIIKPHVNEIVPQIIEILRSDDVMWKYFVLIALLRQTTNAELLNEIERLSKYPTKDEIENDVNSEALSILNGDYK